MSKRFPHLDIRGPARPKDLLAEMVDKTNAHMQGNLTPEQEELGWRNIGAARGAVGQLIKDPTLAYKYSQNQDRWRVWMGMADGTLVMGSRLGTQVHYSAMIMHEIIGQLGPESMRGAGVDEVLARQHARLEEKKAAARQHIAQAGWKMLVDYPVTMPRLQNFARFMQDHAGMSGAGAEAAQETLMQARQNMGGGTSRPAPVQQNLFST